MARFSFSNFNKEKLFSFDTSAITGKYVKTKDLLDKDGEGIVYQVKGLYISRFSKFNPEAPVVALKDTYVNLPQFQLQEIKDMIADPTAVSLINKGRCGFSVRQYETEDFGTCYAAKWLDVNPRDFDNDDDVDEDEADL